ncbi:glutamate 5-kinase [Hanseniaspora valbyensis NRRL Y-1626]|uniref:Glutamate 5-kinase n=1 Tax=Hanseniaspora valbyensis NRRL Y-1626 TaxID=766949 RepID=A0A1B7TEA1_9ASCO|nr:glutamate 5-kinase [Hanseniaspora valbyensis NRRL Y-1626]
MSATNDTTKPLTIVIKLGSSSLVDEKTKEPRLSLMSKIVETCIKLKREFNHKIIIVSSGGIAVGLKTLNIDQKPKEMPKKQAIAAVGQGKLIARWDNLFKQFSQIIAQILITRNDILNWTQFKNAQNTMLELLNMNVIPIVNENDTISTQEIKFGDNDTLSAITASMINADYLFLLTDVDCLYTDNPRVNPDAKPVYLVEELSDILGQVDVSNGAGSSVGTGGMSTKLIAANLSTSSGTHCVITNAENPENIYEIVSSFGKLSDNGAKYIESINKGEIPRHTIFKKHEDMSQFKSRDFWILHGLVSLGNKIFIDNGCKEALTRKNKAGLLPVGIKKIEGTFHDGDCVEICNIDRDNEFVGKCIVNYGSSDIEKIKGLQSDKIEEVLGFFDSEYVAERGNIAFPV